MIRRKGFKKYQAVIQRKEICKILKKGELQESYNAWVDEVEKTKSKVAESIKNNVNNRGKIQKIKRKLKKKEQNSHQVLNSQDQKLETKDEILK